MGHRGLLVVATCAGALAGCACVAGRINASAPGGRGATTGGDPAARADSVREVVAFFGRRLE